MSESRNPWACVVCDKNLAWPRPVALSCPPNCPLRQRWYHSSGDPRPRKTHGVVPPFVYPADYDAMLDPVLVDLRKKMEEATRQQVRAWYVEIEEQLRDAIVERLTTRGTIAPGEIILTLPDPTRPGHKQVYSWPG